MEVRKYQEIIKNTSREQYRRLFQDEWIDRDKPGPMIVLAGNYRWYLKYCHANGLDPRSQARYISSPDQCLGLELKSMDDVAVTCGFWELKDAGEIWESLRRRIR